MTAQPIQAQSLCIAIASKLRERILSHQMPPGSDINDGVLAQSLASAVHPYARPWKLLYHEGLLTAQARRGMTVTQLTAAQVAEARLLCHLLAQHLSQLKAQPLNRCTELTERLHAVAQARLHLALGPGSAYTCELFHPQAVHQHAALAL